VGDGRPMESWVGSGRPVEGKAERVAAVERLRVRWRNIRAQAIVGGGRAWFKTDSASFSGVSAEAGLMY
jgi:hypothetical protein